ncbi:MAG: hypothetical protein ACTHKP_07780, partial [Nitrososphaeraceae archaeon]
RCGHSFQDKKAPPCRCHLTRAYAVVPFSIIITCDRLLSGKNNQDQSALFSTSGTYLRSELSQ